MGLQQLGSSDVFVSPLIMGTWQAGKSMWVGIDDQDISQALLTAYEQGINTFDTAPGYGDGYSERILGKTLKSHRQRLVYATKISSHKLGYQQLIQSCDTSLKDLDTDYIDLYQIHWPAGSFGSKKVPIEESMKALNELKQAGKIRAIGVSNFSKKQLEEAMQYGTIDSIQPPYSLFWRHVETELAPFCHQHKITLLAYSPLAQGLLTGRFGPGHSFEKGDHRSKNKLFQPDVYPKVLEAVEQLKPIAERYNASLSQIALAWVTAHPNTCAIAGARNAEQAQSNAGANQVSLSAKDFAEMNAISCTVTEALDQTGMLWGF